MKFKQSQKFRVIVSGVSVYVTKKQIVWGIGDQLSTNAAVAAALTSLQNMNAADGGETVGVTARFNNIDVQIDVV